MVRLSGQLICKGPEDVAIVVRFLPQHLMLTRAEPGCISFQVRQTDDPLVWQVDEEFIDATAFAAHQERVANSDWGRLTAEITRRYGVTYTDLKYRFEACSPR
jgi:quinol monooxygenase YgiN